MKLEELTGLDSYRKVKNMKSDNVSDIWSNNTNKDFEIIDPLLDILESEGFIVINSSVYAIVLLGNNSVIKFSLYDTAYDNYIKMLKNIPDNLKSFAPIIKGKTKFKQFDVYKIEKLTETSEKFFNTIKKVRNDLQNRSVPIEQIKETIEIFYPEILQKNKFNMDILDYVDYIRKNSDDILDLHGGNFMMRNNTIVLIDPFVR